MRVSVITVVHNGENVIERTLESVYRQKYTNLEYWVIDGASTDGTLEKVKKYEERFLQKGTAFHYISEPDQGIYDAMNKGIKLATGDVIGFINAGDTYEEGAVPTAVRKFAETDCDLLFGDLQIITTKGRKMTKKAKQRTFYQTSRDWNHPTMFVKTEWYRKYPFAGKGIHDDYAFYLKMRKQNRKIAVINQRMATFRMGGASNERNWKSVKRRIQDRYLYCYRENGYGRWYLAECVMTEVAKWLLG
ncbi:MAG: glycosyltransferase [Lachnospiraceae bacterium]|nr:glycosyltransferase [Lachnospiraceae bacterium]